MTLNSRGSWLRESVRSSSLDLEIGACSQFADLNELRAVREQLRLARLEALEKANTALAYPTSTVQVVQQER